MLAAYLLGKTRSFKTLKSMPITWFLAKLVYSGKYMMIVSVSNLWWQAPGTPFILARNQLSAEQLPCSEWYPFITLMVEVRLLPLKNTNWRSPDMGCKFLHNLLWKHAFLISHWKLTGLKLKSKVWWNFFTCSCTRRFHTIGSIKGPFISRNNRSRKCSSCGHRGATMNTDLNDNITWLMTQRIRAHGGHAYAFRWSYRCWKASSMPWDLGLERLLSEACDLTSGKEIDSGLSGDSTYFLEHSRKKWSFCWADLILAAHLVCHNILSPQYPW